MSAPKAHSATRGAQPWFLPPGRAGSVCPTRDAVKGVSIVHSQGKGRQKTSCCFPEEQSEEHRRAPLILQQTSSLVIVVVEIDLLLDL